MRALSDCTLEDLTEFAERDVWRYAGFSVTRADEFCPYIVQLFAANGDILAESHSFQEFRLAIQ